MSYSPIGYLTYLKKGASQCQGQRIPRPRSMGVANGRGSKVIEVKYPSVYPKYGKCSRTPIYYTIVVTSI